MGRFSKVMCLAFIAGGWSSVPNAQETNLMLFGKQEIYSDGNIVGRVRGPGNSAGLHVNVEYFPGLLTPGKSHSFVVTAPESDQTECAGGNQIVIINGFSIKGVPISRR